MVSDGNFVRASRRLCVSPTVRCSASPISDCGLHPSPFGTDAVHCVTKALWWGA
jgi:hypothetical protein